MKQLKDETIADLNAPEKKEMDRKPNCQGLMTKDRGENSSSKEVAMTAAELTEKSGLRNLRHKQ